MYGEKLKAGVLIILAICSGALVRWHLFDSVGSRSPDEYYYRCQAQTLVYNGILTGSRMNMQMYHEEEWRWMNPPSSRVGFIIPVALMQSFLSDDNERSGALVSLICSILSVGVVCACGIILGGPWLGAIAALFAIFSPFDLAVFNRSWTDGPLAFLSDVALLGALLMRRRSVLFWTGALIFGAASFWAIWVKESGFIIPAIFILASIRWENRSARSFGNVLKRLVVPAVAVIASVAALSLFLGDFDQLPIVFQHLKTAVPQAWYARDYQDGPWYDLFLSWWELAPASLLLLFISWPIFLLSKRAKRCQFDFLPLMAIALIFLIPPAVLHYYKNLRYLSPLYGLGALLIAFPAAKFADAKAQRGFNAWGAAVIAVVTIVIALDFSSYTNLVIKRECWDLNLRMLRECKAAPIE